MISESSSISVPYGKKTQGFKNKFKMVLGLICGIPFILVMVLSLPSLLLKIMVIILAKIFRPDLGNVLNGLSSLLVNDYFYNKNSPRANVVITTYLQGHDVSVEELKENVLEKWIHAKDNKTGKLKFNQFQQYPVRWVGFTFYKKYADTFNISDHIHVHNQSNLKTNFVNDEYITNICEKLLNCPFKPCVSPWEIHLVKNYKDVKTIFDSTKTTFVLIFKIHHSLADGYSMLTALVEGFGNDLSNVDLPVPRFPTRNIRQKLLYYICLPYSILYEISYIFSHIFRHSSWIVPNENKTWHQHCSKSDFIPIEKVKFIKGKFGVSFTSVLLRAISSAIHNTLQDTKDHNTIAREVNSFLKDEDDMSSMFCMSVLPLPGHNKGLVNHATMALFDLPIASNNSIRGLHVIDHMLETTKQSVIPFFVPLYLTCMGWHVYPVGNFIGNKRIFPTGLTNFPSVPFQMEQGNRKGVGVDFMTGGLDGGTGVMVMVLSYGEYIRISVTAEKAVMSKDEIKKFTNYMTDEISHLYDEASLKYTNISNDTLSNLCNNGKNNSLRKSSLEIV